MLLSVIFIIAGKSTTQTTENHVYKKCIILFHSYAAFTSKHSMTIRTFLLYVSITWKTFSLFVCLVVKFVFVSCLKGHILHNYRTIEHHL